MELVATLVKKLPDAKKILQQVPNRSIVLFPENVCFDPRTVRKYSQEKNLFIIYNHDLTIGKKKFIAMDGMDRGKEMWTVRKFNLWHTDYRHYVQAPEPEPIVSVRGYRSALVICYDIMKITCRGRILDVGRQVKKERPMLFFVTANWTYNFGIPQASITTIMNNIKSIRASVFSSTHGYALISTKKEKQKITKKGWISIEI